MSSRPSSYALTAPGPIRLYSTTELLALPPPTWLVEHVFTTNALVGLYGPPGEGKSFVAIDLALSIAAGGSWHTHRVSQGYVLYISAEGNAGIGKRIKAWLQDRSVDVRHVEAHAAWLTQAISVYGDSNDLEILVARITDEIQHPPTFIVVDTLARCFDGNENTQEDMGRFIKGVDKLRTVFGSTILVVHHTRLDGERERGNTAFRGATDTMISLKSPRGSNILHVQCTRQKDAEEFAAFQLRLTKVEGTESCVVSSLQQTKSNTLVETLRAHGPMKYDALRLKAHLSDTSFKRHLMSLREKGEILRENDLYKLAGPTENGSGPSENDD
jgi:hypothetical protein